MKWVAAVPLALIIAVPAIAADAEHHHDHPAPERLGAVTFATSCNPAVKPAFDRALALLHSFAYTVSEQAFHDVSARDPGCAMAHWGMAMTHYHQLWEAPSGDELREGAAQIGTAADIPRGSRRERQFIDALELYYRDAERTPAAVRAERYARAMAEVARSNPEDVEAQIFYALALIATASPTDKTHANQKRAADMLEPIYRRQPQHPGLAHYLIHAYDSAELAPRGLAAARAYSRIAPSAPHALHMPSHIFTRLGLWDDSIASNIAARAAAHAQGDLGEELHAMDYLTYAYLQRGRYVEAEQVVVAVLSMKDLPASQFKVGYAATAMRVRLAVERRDWDGAAKLEPLPGSTPQVAAIVYWARALGHARAKVPTSPDANVDRLQACLNEVRASGDEYWASQVDAMLKEAQAWRLAAEGKTDAAILSLRSAADEEDAIEKSPVTPGPVVPAREQLGELLLGLKHPDQALREFNAALALSPGRHGALVGAIEAAEQLGDTKTANQLRAK
jgi:tetratricopeptide (TPR) repeat protein